MSLHDVSLSRRQFLRGASLAAAMPVFASLAACGGNNANNDAATTDANKTDATQAMTLIVGFDQDFPPYGYLDENGQFTGFDLDLAQEVCKLEGWTYQPEAIAWDSKDAQLNSGQITCIWNGFTIEGREKDYAFTDAYMENRQVIVVSADSDIKALADLAGKNVVTQADSAALNLLSEGGDQAELGKTFAKLDTIGEYNTAFMSLQNGEYDAVAVDYPVATFNIGDKKSSFRILDENLSSEHYGVGFAKGDAGSELAKKVEADLRKLDEQGKVREICQKYQDKGVSYDLWVLPKA